MTRRERAADALKNAYLEKCGKWVVLSDGEVAASSESIAGWLAAADAALACGPASEDVRRVSVLVENRSAQFSASEVAAARRNLAALDEAPKGACGTCGGTGRARAPRDEGGYMKPCPTCRGGEPR